MHFDDRLATVLRTSAGGERASRTQYRQLLDLVGTAPAHADRDLLNHALVRLDVLSRRIPVAERAVLLRDPALRLRNPGLLAWLAGGEIQLAQPALARARLAESEWVELIPELSVTARGLLRHREDLPPAAKGLLARLGVRDLILPEPPAQPAPSQDAPGADILELRQEARPADLAAVDLRAANGSGESEDSEIAVIMRRIEAFQRLRKASERSASAPRLPLGDRVDDRQRRLPQAFDFSTDQEGRINWADPGLAPATLGLSLVTETEDAAAHATSHTRQAMRLRQPIRGDKVVLEGAPAIAGEWRLDAAPHFSVADGSFLGYRGRFRRIPATDVAPVAAGNPTADTMRQILHELRTPVNAIQGFAEVIQQQVFGPAPNEYRALAAAIGVDVARIQAGFDELDRLAKLQSGALEIEQGPADLVAIAGDIIRRLNGALRSRGAEFDLHPDTSPLFVAPATDELQQTCWRVLASMASCAAPGESLEASLRADETAAHLVVELPVTLEDRENIFASMESGGARAVTAGMFGLGFTLRLARAEARAAGGDLTRTANAITLTLPLKAASANSTEGDERAGNSFRDIQ